MKFDPRKQRSRQSIRLRDFDYAAAGFYFVTMCTQHRKRLFGEVVGAEMRLSDAGRMVEAWYARIESKFPDVVCDAFVLMPDHVHFLLFQTGGVVEPVFVEQSLRGEAPCASGAGLAASVGLGVLSHVEERRSSLSQVVGWFKTMTTNAYIRGVKEERWPRFEKRLWQRDYYEQILHGTKGADRVRRYITNNPAMWRARR